MIASVDRLADAGSQLHDLRRPRRWRSLSLPHAAAGAILALLSMIAFSYRHSFSQLGTLVATLMLSFVAIGHGQLPSLELHTLSPPVVRAGETTTVSLTGLNLDELKSLHFSSPGISAKPVMLPESEFRQSPTQDGTKFAITVPKDTAPGPVEVRVSGYFGISTSRPLTIAAADREVIEDKGATHHDRTSAPELPIGALAWGRTDVNQIDWWKLSARKGQRFIIHATAEAIDSRADAVLTLVDQQGLERERNRDHLGRDPLLDFTAPADGDYWVGVSDFLYRGGATYPYLLTINEGPWIEAVFPPAGQPGQVMEATLLGRNLEGGSLGEGLSVDGQPLETLPVKITIPENGSPLQFASARPKHALLPGFRFQQESSNSIEIGFATAPVIPVTNDATIPPVTPPAEIAARFETEGDEDAFRFQARKGVSYWIEVIGDRLNSRIDPYLLIEKVSRAEDGKESFSKIKEADDETNTGGSRFDAGSRDSRVSFTAAENGEYQVTVINQFDSGSALDTYRLSLREAQPDFALIGVTERDYHEARQAYPSAPLIRKGGTSIIRVLVQRKDGFDGPITISADKLPPGVTCPSIVARNGETSVNLVFHADRDAAPWAGAIGIQGTATLGEQQVTRPLRTGSLVWGSGDSSKDRLRSRLDLEAPLAISQSEASPVHFGVDADAPLEVVLGEKLEIPIKVHLRNGVKGNLAVSPFGLKGLTKPPSINIAEGADKGTLSLSFKPQPNVFSPTVGTWNFVLRATGTTKYRHRPEAVEAATVEQKLAEELATKYTKQATESKKAEEAAKQSLEQASQNLAAASVEAKATAETAVAGAKARFETAQKEAAAAEAKRVAAEKAKTAAAARTKAATDKAKERDLKFAAYSLPLTVVVKPAPEPEKKP